MYYAITLAIGAVGGALGYHFLFSPVSAQLAALHVKFDEVLAALKK